MAGCLGEVGNFAGQSLFTGGATLGEAQVTMPRSSDGIRLAKLAVLSWLVAGAIPTSSAGDSPSPRIAAIVTEYRHNSHADVIVSRLLTTNTLDGKGDVFPLKLVSLYTDQKPENDISRRLAAKYQIPIKPSIAETLTLGTKTLAVDGVLLVAEHGSYPFSATGNHQYPKRRLWEETVKVFRESGRVVPVFIDKHLSDNWEDAKTVYDTARELKIPLMAGSSVPGAWRYPPADVSAGARISEIVAFTYGSTDAYGFHGLEALQSLAEQRQGGETGVRSVQCLTGDAAWKAFDDHRFDPEIYDAALSRLPRHEHGEPLDRKAVAEPKVMIIEYEDGLRAFLLEMNGAADTWTAAWRYHDGRRIESTQFWLQEGRPAAHFGVMLEGITKMMLSGKPASPVERTLLTSGVLDALLQSETLGGKPVVTPYLRVSYRSGWRWKQPPPPPPMRPWAEE